MLFRSEAAKKLYARLAQLDHRAWVKENKRADVARIAAENEPELLNWYNETETKNYCESYCKASIGSLADKYLIASRMINTPTHAEFTTDQRDQLLVWLQQHLGYIPSVDTTTSIITTSATTTIPANSYALDPELARIAIALKLDHALRVWACIHAADTKGEGRISLRQIAPILRQFGVEMNAHTRQEAIRGGKNIFFGINKSGMLHTRSYARVAEALIQRAQDIAPDVVATNTPGAQPRYISLVGSAVQFRAACYAAWIAYRESDGLQGISRYTLQRLWNTTTKTLIQYEKLGGIQAVEAIAQYAGTDTALIPQDAYGNTRGDVATYRTRNGEARLKWSASNHYRVSSISIQKRTGKRIVKRVAAVCRDAQRQFIYSDTACSDIGAAISDEGAGFRRIGKRFFVHSATSKARKHALSHQKRHQDYHQPRYVQLAVKCLKRGDVVIYDCVDRTAPQTTPHELFTLAFPQQYPMRARKHA